MSEADVATRDDAEEEVRCHCGHGRWHPRVSHEFKYNALGWFLLMMGATPEPVSMEWTCKVCGESLGTSKRMADFNRARR